MGMESKSIVARCEGLVCDYKRSFVWSDGIFTSPDYGGGYIKNELKCIKLKKNHRTVSSLLKKSILLYDN